MVAKVAPATPSPPRDLPSTPPAPRFGGYYDNWQPYGARRSARIISQSGSDRTPSPHASERQQLSSPQSNKKPKGHRNDGMASPTASPKKHRDASTNATRHIASDRANSENSDKDTSLKAVGKKHASSAAASHSANTLPTPSKTPQRPPHGKAVAEISTFARNLFPSEQTALSSPRKRSTKKLSGMTMDSFTAESEDEAIEIFEDTRDRIPRKDDSKSNPFSSDYVPGPETTKRRSRRKQQILIEGEGMVPLEEAAARDDGIVYNFRGKKFFRKIADGESTQAENPSTVGASGAARLLFPKEKSDEITDDEEAATDVEDTNMLDANTDPQTPTKGKQHAMKTPAAPRFAPTETFATSSTAATQRSTRSAKLGSEASTSRNSSPFDLWKRTKDRASNTPAKRPAEPVADTQAKRTRT